MKPAIVRSRWHGPGAVLDVVGTAERRRLGDRAEQVRETAEMLPTRERYD